MSLIYLRNHEFAKAEFGVVRVPFQKESSFPKTPSLSTFGNEAPHHITPNPNQTRWRR